MYRTFKFKRPHMSQSWIEWKHGSYNLLFSILNESSHQSGGVLGRGPANDQDTKVCVLLNVKKSLKSRSKASVYCYWFQRLQLLRSFTTFGWTFTRRFTICGFFKLMFLGTLPQPLSRKIIRSWVASWHGWFFEAWKYSGSNFHQLTWKWRHLKVQCF